MPLTADTRYFALAEFKHPELMSADFVAWLNKVRAEYGFPIRLTSDARTPAENDALKARGSSPSSRHLAGEAIDMAYPPTANHVWLLVEAVMKCQTARPIELELVPADGHIHIAWLQPGRASSLIIASD